MAVCLYIFVYLDIYCFLKVMQEILTLQQQTSFALKLSLALCKIGM